MSDRANYLGTVAFYRLDRAAVSVLQAFDFSYGVFLVGSALRRPDFRDVDVRCIVADEDFERLFQGAPGASWRHPLWALTCSSISMHLARTTDLPIDFQVQPATEANRDYGGAEHGRCALGLSMLRTDSATKVGGGT